MMRYTVYFSGRVQGVGFRYTVAQLAANLPIAGYVRNLTDGRVELVAEGDKQSLDDLLAAVRRRMASNIGQMTVDTTPGNGEFGDPGSPTCDPLSIRY